MKKTKALKLKMHDLGRHFDDNLFLQQFKRKKLIDGHIQLALTLLALPEAMIDTDKKTDGKDLSDNHIPKTSRQIEKAIEFQTVGHKENSSDNTSFKERKNK